MDSIGGRNDHSWIAQDFLSHHPTTMIDFADEVSLGQEGRVIRGELGFGLGLGQCHPGTELEFTPITRDLFIVVMRPDSPLARADELSIDSVVDYPMISLTRGAKLRAQLETQFSPERAQIRWYESCCSWVERQAFNPAQEPPDAVRVVRFDMASPAREHAFPGHAA
jgi:DNA-binding transcriptional LysR family regulator